MQAQRQVVEITTTNAKPRRFVFALLENFSMLSFSSAVESLRIANRMADKTLYEWMLVGEGGDMVRCSAGTVFVLDDGLTDLNRDDTVILCEFHCLFLFY